MGLVRSIPENGDCHVWVSSTSRCCLRAIKGQMRAIGGYLLGLVEAVWRTINSGGCIGVIDWEFGRLYRSF